jgi:hypothetical protein
MSVNDYLDGILEDDLAQLELQSRRQSTPTVHIHHRLSNAHPRIIFHLHASVPISSSFLGSTLPSSPAQAGCCRYNPSNAALPSTVRLLPACSVGTLICLSRTTNLPLSRRLSVSQILRLLTSIDGPGGLAELRPCLQQPLIHGLRLSQSPLPIVEKA